MTRLHAARRTGRSLRYAGFVLGLLAPAHTARAGPPAIAKVDPFATCIEQLRAVANSDANKGAPYYCIYGAARTSGDHDRGIALLEAELVRDPGNPWAHDNLAALLMDSGGPAVVEHYEAAVSGYAARGESVAQFWALLSFADNQARVNLDAADPLLLQARGVAADIGDPNLIAMSDVQWARQLSRRGENIAEALRLVRNAEPTVMGQRLYQPRLALLHTKSVLLRSIGRPSEAAEVLEQIIAANEGVNDHYIAAKSTIALATLLSANRTQYSSAAVIEMARKGLKLATRYGNRYAQAAAHCLLGDMRADDPLEHYQQCHDIWVALDGPVGVAGALGGKALLNFSHDEALALRQLDEAAAIARARGGESLIPAITRALLLWEGGHNEAALAASMTLLDDAEQIYFRQRNPLTRAQVLARWSSVNYAVADRVLHASGEPPAAPAIDLTLAVMERMRARVLIERLDAGEAENDTERAGQGLQAAHRIAVDQITQIQRRLLHDDLQDEQRASLLTDLSAAERQEVALSDARIAADPRLAGLRSVEAPTLAALQRVLEPDQAILSYQLATPLHREAPEPWPVTSSLIVITKNDTQAFPLPPREELAPLIDLFAGLFEARDGSEVAPAVGLYHSLFADGLASLPDEVTRLVVVADGPVHRLPIAALRSGPTQPPLVARYSITTVPSLRLWLRLRQDLPTPGGAALVFADPQLPQPDGDSPPSMAEGLGPLPHARREAAEVARRLGDRTQVHVGAAATEAAFKSAEMADFSVMHFASHAWLDSANPERAAIVLASGNASEDGLLQTREIARLSMPGAVVVLAACSSGSGVVVGGEGPVGLARAFFIAGARSVVASLWRVRDDEGQAFFGAFYEHLARGMSVSTAVRAAQDDRRMAGAPAAAWAGFVVLGDGDYAPLPTTPMPLGWFVLAAVAVLGTGYLGLRLRARARQQTAPASAKAAHASPPD